MSTQTTESKQGIVYTFYSFKGGSGRTMALANVAALMAKWGRSVLVVDWDLEAPGLERFFAADNYEAYKLRSSNPGVIDLVSSFATQDELDWRKCVISLSGGVSLITAGREEGSTYIRRAQKLNFANLFKRHNLGSYVEKLRTEWISSYEFVLIDSRTGVTDIGGICTVHLPDVLVLFFTANDSSTEGAIDVVTRARKALERLPIDRGNLLAVPIPSRDESRTEYDRAMQWKRVLAEKFSSLYSEWLPRPVTPLEAVELLRIPYVPYWSFGEQLPVLKEGSGDPGSLGYAYELLARLLATRLKWSEAIEGRKVAPPAPTKPREIEMTWVATGRTAAMNGLKKWGKPGFMEVYHLCADSVVTKRQDELVTIAEQASVHTFGWPIGLVLRNREEFRPKPTNEGIIADIETEHSYDYWMLRTNGDFYTLTSLFEDFRAEGVLYFDTRIVQTTEVILHATNIYKAFGIENNRTIELTIRYGGLIGRRLIAASPNRLNLFTRQNLTEEEVKSIVTFRVGATEKEITTCVKEICDPLFMIFEFAKITDEIYEHLVSNFIQGRVV